MEKEYISIGNIDRKKYSKLCNYPITTTQVIITNKQIEHIKLKRESIFNKYKGILRDIIIDPDYIIKDTKHLDTGLVIKKYSKNVILVLKLNTAQDNKKNSIITIWEIKEKRFQRYLSTHEIIYKKE